MFSIFDQEEEDILFKRARMVMPLTLVSQRASNLSMLGPYERATYFVPGQPRKRTKLEALERLPPPPKLEGLPYGVQRALRRPVGIYTVAYFVAAGLILVDPLDRLE